MEKRLRAEPGNLCVAQHEARKSEERTGNKEEASEVSPTILYGYTAERVSGAPNDFKVFAGLDKQAHFMKGTLPEGRLWDHVWWRVTREHPSKEIVEPAPMRRNLADGYVHQTLFEPTDITAELWYSPTTLWRQACPLHGLL